MGPLISVIIPIYNAEEYLKECIESVQKQKYNNLQILLINDGSTDKSLEICKYYEKNDNRIVVIDRPNSGVSASRNIGINLARGKYISFVDSDDYLQEDMYEKLIDIITKDNSDLCALTKYTIRVFDKKLINKNHSVISKENAIKNLLLLKFPSSLWAYLYKKEIMEGLLLDENIHFFEDFEFNLRILLNSKKISICDKDLYYYRINPNSTNSQKINDKRMTSLGIYKILYKRVESLGKPYVDMSLFFHSHSLISVLLSTSKVQSAKGEYYEIIKKSAREIKFKVFINRYVPLSYKILIWFASISPIITCRFIYQFKYRNSH